LLSKTTAAGANVHIASSLLSTTASAPGNEIHVIGTVSKISPSGVSVTTKDGNIVQVTFGDKTSCLRVDMHGGAGVFACVFSAFTKLSPGR
jgi:hypothetical protein